MGILQTIYAHWKLNRMIRTWRKSRRLISKLDSFIKRNATAEELEAFKGALTNVDDLLSGMEENIENEIISELKDN
jgi:hypothetical protein